MSTYVTSASMLVLASSQVVSQDSVSNNLLLRLLAWAHLLRSVYKKDMMQAGLLLATLPRFNLGLRKDGAGDNVCFLSHVYRYLCYWRFDLKLPPRVHLSTFLQSRLLTEGMWQRHKFERLDVTKDGEKGLVSLMIPMNRMNWRKPGTLLVFVGNPKDVEQILTDKNAFPTRGHTGFNDFVGEGLLGMVTGKKHASHRRLITKFLSEAHLMEFAKVVEQVSRCFGLVLTPPL
jgi:hypothetical protein